MRKLRAQAQQSMAQHDPTFGCLHGSPTRPRSLKCIFHLSVAMLLYALALGWRWWQCASASADQNNLRTEMTYISLLLLHNLLFAIFSTNKQKAHQLRQGPPHLACFKSGTHFQHSKHDALPGVQVLKPNAQRCDSAVEQRVFTAFLYFFF